MRKIVQPIVLCGMKELKDADHSKLHLVYIKNIMSIPNEIMISRDWYNFVHSVRKKIPMKITDMGQNGFLSYSHLLTDKLVNRTKDTDGNPVKWLQIKWLIIRRR